MRSPFLIRTVNGANVVCLLTCIAYSATIYYKCSKGKHHEHANPY